MGKKLTQEQVIKDFKKVHGEVYDYSKVHYVNNKTKVTIICEVHGEFEQEPSKHKTGAGCARCGGVKKLNTEQVIKDFIQVHGDKYDYSKVQYGGNKTKVTIICKEHGGFEQSPNCHKTGKGCPSCGGGKKLTQEQVIKDFIQVHGDKYDYSKVQYVNNKTKVTIICKEHGEFEQTPSHHKTGAGCGRCSGGKQLTTEEAIEDFKRVHGDTYDYSKVQYVSTMSKVTIICKEHGEFEQIPSSHKSGVGCPSCAVSGFKTHLPATLYYLSINNGQCYKIGITNLTVEQRFTSKDLEHIEVLKTWDYPIGQDAYDNEQKILKEFEYAKYEGEDILESGNTELFSYDVLMLESCVA